MKRNKHSVAIYVFGFSMCQIFPFIEHLVYLLVSHCQQQQKQQFKKKELI